MAETDITKLIKEALEKGLSEGIAMAAMANRQAQPAPYVAPDMSTCEVCKQQKRGCKGEHVKMAVYPGNPRFGRHFQGCQLNGVVYLSNSAQHLIWVPKRNDFLQTIQNFERNEDEMMNGRVAEHNSGEIGRGARGVNPAQSAWR